jgi:hypothetical protein
MNRMDVRIQRVQPGQNADLAALITGDNEHPNYCELAGIEFKALLWYIIPANQKR